MRTVVGRGTARAAAWVTAGALGAASIVATTVAPVRADSPVSLMNASIECYVAVKGMPGADCIPNKKFPNKAIEFVIQGDLNTNKPVKFRNPASACNLGWFDDKLACYQHPTYANDKASTWKVHLDGDKGYTIENVGAKCHLYIDPTGVVCAPGRPDPNDTTFFWRLLG